MRCWSLPLVLLFAVTVLPLAPVQVPTNGYIGYNTVTGAVSAAITVTIVKDDEECECNPVTLKIYTGCPASGNPVTSFPGSMDPTTGVVTGSDPTTYPGLDPGICGLGLQLEAVCSGSPPCPMATECVGVTCTS